LPRRPALPDPLSSVSVPPHLPRPSSLLHGNGNNLRARSIPPTADVVASSALFRAVYSRESSVGAHLQPRAAGGPWGSGQLGCRQTRLCFSRASHKTTTSTSSPEDMGKQSQRGTFGWGGSRWQWLVAMDIGCPNNATEYWLTWRNRRLPSPTRINLEEP
jgi:hypothetical protein